MHDEQFAGESHDGRHEDLSVCGRTQNRTLTRMPVWLKVTGKRIMDVPIMELAMATPVMMVDLPIVLYIYFGINRNLITVESLSFSGRFELIESILFL